MSETPTNPPSINSAMKILIDGSHGMIGSVVTRHLVEGGFQVTRLVRHTPNPGEVRWNPDTDEIDHSSLDGVDGVVHLATMAWPMRWTENAKQKIRRNRLATNGLLAKSLAVCVHKPKVLICASGLGYYPSSGDAVLTEDTPAGTSFLSKLQQDGDAATAPASETGIRVVNLCIPAVLGGPALQRVGIQAGNGLQWVSWVGRDELASIIEFALMTENLTGPVNATSPNPIRNAELGKVVTQTLGQRPRIRLPAFVMRLVMGEMGEELLLASRRMQSAKLLAAGYQFHFPELEGTLRHEMESMKISLASQPA